MLPNGCRKKRTVINGNPEQYLAVMQSYSAEASVAYASDRSLKVCYDRSLANAKLAQITIKNCS